MCVCVCVHLSNLEVGLPIQVGCLDVTQALFITAEWSANHIVKWDAVSEGRGRGREGGKEGGREGKREGGKEGGREGEREGKREGGKEGGRERGRVEEVERQ